jgi:integrase
MRKMLTDRFISSLKPAIGQRTEVWDEVVTGLGVRASTTMRGGQPYYSRTFVLVHRFGGNRNPTRRSLGRYGRLTLQDARIKARRWLELIDHGKDPAVELERERLAEARKRADTFSAVAQAFIEQKLRKERQGKDAERTLRRFIGAWGSRPITDIDRRDVRELIDPVAVHAPYMAHSMLCLIKRFFSWCVEQDRIEASPCALMRASKIIGARKPRQRVLSEDELVALHRVASEMPYPHGPLLLVLLYTGQRHSDVALCPWSEISLERREWIIAAGRFKSEVRHLVPLSQPMVELLSSLPRFGGSDKVFSYYGRSLRRGIVAGIKDHLDADMLEVLKQLAHERGQDSDGIKLEPWVVHDIRRSCRTRLTQLKIQTEVAEAVIGHGKRGLERHYNLYEYADEKRDALERWASWLRNLTSPPVPNVVPMPVRVS